MTTLSLMAAREIARRVLQAAGTAPANAESVARALVAAEADGLASHGLSRLPAYADQAKAGKVVGDAVAVLTETAPGALKVDAKCGFAFPAIAAGLARAAAMAKRSGTVAVSVGNSHHFGVAAYHIEPLADQGLVALAFGNSPAAIAPWGGTKPVFGTNPIAFACPCPGREPLVIDLSLSKVARGKIMVAAQKGEPIPEGWALDGEGKPTTDAKAALGGAMVAMGDAKGTALVLMVELLSAALSAAHFGYEASSFFDAKGGPPRVGQFFLVLDPARFAGEMFARRVGDLVAAILAQPGARLPGDRRLAARAKAREQGIAISDDLHADLVRRSAGG
ncbi:MAG: Ldh family oxidoreductase [Alphaproteobacteria bacterium]|nr:Ldh family oxidoreductase [Alphaproteobacteria bacterium]